MNDIVERLRNWTFAVDAPPASDLMDQAADEIERLRADWLEQLPAHSVLIAEQELEIKRLRLTAEEREAVAYYLGTGGPYGVDKTLVSLLSRAGTIAAKTSDDAAQCLPNDDKTPERERLTDAEREAVEYFAAFQWTICKPHVAAMRGLLERL